MGISSPIKWSHQGTHRSSEFRILSESGGVDIFHVGIEHFNRPEHPHFRVVKSATEKFLSELGDRPATVLLESATNVRALLSMSDEDALRLSGEFGYVAKKAYEFNLQKGRDQIRLAVAEAPESQQFKMLCDQGFDPRDVLLIFGLREFAYCITQSTLGSTEATTDPNFINNQFAALNNRIQQPEQLTPQKLMQLFKERTGRDFNSLSYSQLRTFDGVKINPFIRVPYLKGVYNALMKVRDVTACNNIVAAATRGPVFLVYGHAHSNEHFKGVVTGLREAGKNDLKQANGSPINARSRPESITLDLGQTLSPSLESLLTPVSMTPTTNAPSSGSATGV